MSLLSEEESRALSHGIELVEQSTAGELVVAVVPRSDDYSYPRALLAVACAVGTGWVLYSVFPTVPSAFVFAAQVVLWSLFWWLSAWGWLLRKLVPREQLVAAVDAKAKQVFFERGLTETIDRSAVLIFVSELEHRVQIVADRGINERVDRQVWQKHVEAVVTAIRAGRPADGLQAVIREIGLVLAAAFPPRENDVNELPNEVVRYR